MLNGTHMFIAAICAECNDWANCDRMQCPGLQKSKQSMMSSGTLLFGPLPLTDDMRAAARRYATVAELSEQELYQRRLCRECHRCIDAIGCDTHWACLPCYRAIMRAE